MSPADQPLPFTERRGLLRIAPLEATRPAVNLTDSGLPDNWPNGWRLVGETDPEMCHTKTAAELVRVSSGPIRLVATEPSRWILGIDQLATGALELPTAPVPGLARVMPPETRMMVGWQALDGTARAIAWQATFNLVPFRASSDGIRFEVKLEQPEQPPRPAVSGWRRLIRWLRREMVMPPAPTVPFTIYRVGDVSVQEV